MRVVATEFARYLAGSVDLVQLRALLRSYLDRHPEELEAIATWIRNCVREGRLPDSLWPSLEDLFTAGGQASHGSGSKAIEAATQRDRTARAERQPTEQSAESQRRSERQVVQPRVGTVIKDRFVLVELLGSGGMGEVFKARDRRREEAQDRNPHIAIKVLTSEFSAHPASFMALQREARRGGTLAHPNVVTVYDFDRDGARIFMTMEYLEGAGLDRYMREQWSSGVSLDKVWPVIGAIGQALEYGHQKGIVHSDLKPGNVFICNDGTVKVLDFGIARLIKRPDTRGDSTIFDPGQRLGGLTPAYASLEMWNRESPDPRDDIYALACVTYELLSGTHPFARASARDAVANDLKPKRIAGLTRSQWRALKQGLALRREQRIPTVRSFLKPFEPQTRLRRYAVPLSLVGIAVATAAVAVGVYYFQSMRDSEFADAQCARLGKPPPISAVAALSETQRADIEAKLALARDYMNDVTTVKDPDELKSILTEGPNSVDYVLDNVLSTDPAQRDAHELKARIAKAYSDMAAQLAGIGRYEQALDMLSYARKTQPYDAALCRFEQSVRQDFARAGAH